MEGGRRRRRPSARASGPPIARHRLRAAGHPSSSRPHDDLRSGGHPPGELVAPGSTAGDRRLRRAAAIGSAPHRVHHRRGRIAADRRVADAPKRDDPRCPMGTRLGLDHRRPRTGQRLDATTGRPGPMVAAQPRRVVAGAPTPDGVRSTASTDHDAACIATRWRTGVVGRPAERGDDAPRPQREVDPRPRDHALPMARRTRRGVAVVTGDVTRRVADDRTAQPVAQGGARRCLHTGRGQREPGRGVRHHSSEPASKRTGSCRRDNNCCSTRRSRRRAAARTCHCRSWCATYAACRENGGGSGSSSPMHSHRRSTH